MRFFSHTFIVLCLVTFSLHSSPQSSKSNSSQAEKKNPRWGVQFSIGPNFTLNSFQGSLISGRYYLNPSRVIQVGVSASTNVSGGDRSQTLPDTSFTTLENSQYAVNLTLIAQYVKIINPDNRWRGLWGIGPLISYSTTFNENTNVLSASRKRVASTKETVLSTGITGIIGSEIQITRFILLTVFYRSSLAMKWSKETFKNYFVELPNNTKSDERTQTNKSRSFFLQNNGVFFGLTVLF